MEIKPKRRTKIASSKRNTAEDNFEKYYSVKVSFSSCDLCNDRLMQAPDDIEAQIDIADQISNSYESECDKFEPRLLLCSYCQKEYLIPSYLSEG